MKRVFSAVQEVELFATLADLRDTNYHNTLVLHALIDLLIEKGVLTREELLLKVRQLDSEHLQPVSHLQWPDEPVSLKAIRHTQGK